MQLTLMKNVVKMAMMVFTITIPEKTHLTNEFQSEKYVPNKVSVLSANTWSNIPLFLKA